LDPWDSFYEILLLTNWADVENEVIKHKVQEMFVTRIMTRPLSDVEEDGLLENAAPLMRGW
jgi:hypothetical protein